ncbi:hypothetical protein [Sedimenticola hydrogenitrophicus]|uniref:hypothetical protein n=1 Tax=Sedimenticola hydrogenitrophicus TaxID=2967975 RepID=UPI0021A2A73E|nr:hypothetical protein [Sedimenticola hydrogenitrophicus]
MKRNIILIFALLLSSPLAHSAKCMVDGEWYDYNDPKCGGNGMPPKEAVSGMVREKPKYDQSTDPY